MQEIALKPCPFCGGTNIQSLKELDFVCCQDCGASLEDSEPSAREHWNTRALPAQGEPVAREAFEAGFAAYWGPQKPDEVDSFVADMNRAWNDYFAALLSSPAPITTEQLDKLQFGRVLHDRPSSPAPPSSSLNSGESELVVMPVRGAGEAIFAECAEIALGHVGMWQDGTYDEACRDIAEAIKTRASNRRTMDAVADVALLKP
jgi:Lar family restriction alleviation protein